MTEKVIGMLGGMGPEATLTAFSHLLRNVAADCDQDHLHVIINNNPKAPDRTRAIVHGETSPVPWLIDGCRRLEKAGADFIVIPCVTAHYFLAEMKNATSLPILSILDVVVDAIQEFRPPIKTIGLMATSGTLHSGIFQEKLAESGLRCLNCSDQIQDQVMEAIYIIKGTDQEAKRMKSRRVLQAAALGLIDNGAEGIIAGCTEIPLGLTEADLPVPYFDSLKLLARSSILFAGGKIKVL